MSSFSSFTQFKSQLNSLLILMILLLSGCAAMPDRLPSSGPGKSGLESSVASNQNPLPMVIVDIDPQVAQSVLANEQRELWSTIFPAEARREMLVGFGDVLEITILEAPPAVLFGSATTTSGLTASGGRVSFPDLVVNADGQIIVPFAGSILVAGKTIQNIQQSIEQRLKGKANQPQVLARITRNVSSNVTVVGDVGTSARVPLTAQSERVLDALAAVGGVRQSVGKMSIQLTRGERVYTLPLDTIIQDPKQNITLKAGDVINALYQSQSFSVLGATGRNDEINFEARGISLSQAIARAGGLSDNRADAQGVFLFRLEEPEALAGTPFKDAKQVEGKIPVVYRVDLKNPASFIVAQSFPIKNRDVMFVSNAPAAELQKFLNVVMSAVYPIITLTNQLGK
ncbi:polysaccharide export protein [Chitinibacter sp. SCUT-21]|uniref:polysaccharide biosynthesis/export family protein n=1 Tax=Chitinibacter sp. SCUT-21 TaxID=2970891 RepID=UPI0035A67D85